QALLVELAAQQSDGIARQKAGDEFVIARMSEVQEALTAFQEPCAPVPEGKTARVIHEYIGRKPMRPTAAPGSQAEVNLFAVAFAKYTGIQASSFAEAVAAHIETKPDPNWNLDALAGMQRLRERIQRGARA